MILTESKLLEGSCSFLILSQEQKVKVLNLLLQIFFYCWVHSVDSLKGLYLVYVRLRYMGINLKLVTHDLSFFLCDHGAQFDDLGAQFDDLSLEIFDSMFATESDKVEGLCSFLILSREQKVKVFDLLIQLFFSCWIHSVDSLHGLFLVDIKLRHMVNYLMIVTHDLCLCDIGTLLDDFGLEILDFIFATEFDLVEGSCSFLILSREQKVKVHDLLLQLSFGFRVHSVESLPGILHVDVKPHLMGSLLKLVIHNLSLCLCDLGTQLDDFGLKIHDCMILTEFDRVEGSCSFLILSREQKVKVLDLLLQRYDKCLLALSETNIEFLLGVHLGDLRLEARNGKLVTLRVLRNRGLELALHLQEMTFEFRASILFV